jgi:hypothetical protein
LYGHVLVGWVFFLFVLFTIYRELVFYTTMRQAYMLSPVYSTRISARTILITTIPEEYQNETALKKIFDHVKRIWINTDTSELDDLVEERDKVALQLEAAEVKLVKMADAARRKAGAEPEKTTEPGMEAEGESGSVAAKWLPRDKRPTHKLKPLIGEKVDTIDWCRGRLAELNPKVEELQCIHRSGEAKKQSSAFIEFESQSAAQTAFQCLAHNKPLHMAPRYIGITPEEIIWNNMRLMWWERLTKSATTTSFVVALVIFWSIPVAVVGLISNITYLTEKVPFLGFINDIPEVILGIVTSVLPTVALAILMALLPIVLRMMARIAGEPSQSNVELRVQSSYFLFQVVQVFLVTTMASGASAAVPKIINNPPSAASLLAESLPTASNFYIAFFILQGLAISSAQLVQIAGLVLYKVLGFLFDNTPRKMWRRWSSLSGLGWGTVFPVYTNLCVIAVTYSIIAPLVMGFAVVGLGLLYFAYRYNFLFVYNISIDTKGLVYPRALYQTLTGVYLAEICLIGLFGTKQAFGPMVLQIIFLVFTILFQMTLSSAVAPLLNYLPRNLQVEEEELLSVERGHASELSDERAHTGELSDERAHTGELSDEKIAVHPSAEHGKKIMVEETKPNFLSKFLKPETYESYAHMRKLIPTEFPEIHYSPEVERDAYYHPSITAQVMALWIPRDEGGVSAQEVAHTSSVQPISDAGAIITEKSKVERLEDSMPPDWIEKIRY